MLGKYHPHGDAPVYDALVRMAQPISRCAIRWWTGREISARSMAIRRRPMRYTEARLSRIAAALLEDIDKETVDFRPNYDESEVEPEVLPTRVPNLLINGHPGIAVGMATKIPPHNLTRDRRGHAFADRCRIRRRTLSKIIEIVQGPDFPTGGFILGRQGICDYFTTGRGSLKIRAKAAIEKLRQGSRSDRRHRDSVPGEQGAPDRSTPPALVNEKKLEGISEIRDESDRDGMRIVFELKRGEQAEVVLNNLYKHTQMQISFGVIMLSIVNGQPRELGLLDALKRFIEHRVDVVRRRTDYLLRKAREREHILLGFQKALDNLDAVIELIRARRRRPTRSVASRPDRPRFEFTEQQAQAIIELQLQRLTGMEQQKILDELAEIQRRIAEYLEILGSEKVLRGLIVKELKEVQKDFGDERRTQIIEDTGEINLEDLVQVEDVAVTVTRGGYLKRTAVDTYRRQTRGGKGRIGMSTRAEDVVEHLIIASTHAYLLIFTNKGRVYWLKIYEIPDAGTSGKGKHASDLINLQPDETVTAFLPVKEFVPDKFIVMVTKQGVIKKCELTEFDNPMSRGIIALALDDGDELLAARLTTGEDYIFLGSHEGMAIRFTEERRSRHGPAGARRSRHGSGRGRLPGRHGSGRRRKA